MKLTTLLFIVMVAGNAYYQYILRPVTSGLGMPIEIRFVHTHF